MPRYTISYSFNGYGDVVIEADNEDSARDLFYDGDYSDQNEDGDNYEISRVESDEPTPIREAENLEVILREEKPIVKNTEAEIEVL